MRSLCPHDHYDHGATMDPPQYIPQITSIMIVINRCDNLFGNYWGLLKRIKAGSPVAWTC